MTNLQLILPDLWTIFADIKRSLKVETQTKVVMACGGCAASSSRDAVLQAPTFDVSASRDARRSRVVVEIGAKSFGQGLF